MSTYPLDIQLRKIFSFLDHPFFTQGVPSSVQEVLPQKCRVQGAAEGTSDGTLSNYSVNDYRVGMTDTFHATMVDEFLRLFCREEPASQIADAVVIVDIQGCIQGYGCRHDSSFLDVFARWYGCLITQMLSEGMRRHWLNQNIESVALQRRHWRLFRLYDTEASHMVLMEFHPIEKQRTALVLWRLEA